MNGKRVGVLVAVVGLAVFAGVGVAIHNSSYTGNSLDVSNEATTALDIAWNDDGTKLYVIDDGSDSVYSYYLSMPYNISTGSYTGNSFGVGSEDPTPTGVTWGPNGTRFYVSGNGNNRIYVYEVNTEYNISTAFYTGDSFSVNQQMTVIQGFAFSGNGSKLFTISAYNSVLYSYDLSGDYNVTTASYTGTSFSFGFGSSGLAWGDSGEKLFVTDDDNDLVHEYNASVKYNIGTLSYTGENRTTNPEQDLPYNIVFNPDGSKYYIVGSSPSAVHSYATNFSWGGGTTTTTTVGPNQCQPGITLDTPSWMLPNSSSGYSVDYIDIDCNVYDVTDSGVGTVTSSVHTTDTDFNNAQTLTNLSVSGSGSAAVVELSGGQGPVLATPHDNGDLGSVGASGSDYFVQSFTADESTIDEVGVWLQEDSAEGEVRLGLAPQDGSGDAAVGSMLWSSQLVDPGIGGSWFNLSTGGVSVTVGETYYVVIDGYQNSGATGDSTTGLSTQSTATGENLEYSSDGGSSWSSWSSPMAVHVAYAGSPPQSASYVGAVHQVSDSVGAAINLSALSNVSVTATARTVGGTQLAQQSLSSVGNHSLSWSETDADVEIVLDVTTTGSNPVFELADESVQTVGAGATVTSNNTSVVTVNTSGNVLEAVDNVNTTVWVNATYSINGSTYYDNNSVVVAQRTVRQLPILPPMHRLPAVLNFGMGPGQTGTLFFLILATLMGAAGASMAGSTAGIAVMQLAILVGWFGGWVGLGLAMVSVFVALFIGLNTALNVDYGPLR